MNKNLSRRERKKQEIRGRLMDAALRLFREQGYDAATVEKIATAADVAKGTFFNYFQTKDAILPALAERRVQQIEDMLSLKHGTPASPVARIKLALRLLAENPLTDPQLAQRLFAAMMKRRQQEVRPGHALAYLLADQIRQAQAAGEIRPDLDPIYVGCVIRTLFFQQMMTWYCESRSTPLPELLDGMVDLLMDGLAGSQWRMPS
jgi:AcrR family transcriptional regulator